MDAPPEAAPTVPEPAPPEGGMTVVWLHGAGQGPDYWDDSRAQGLRLALPGHAGRPRATRPTVEAMADALTPDLPPGRFDLIGHSLGGQIAMELAARLPDRIRRLVLVDTRSRPTGRRSTDFARALRDVSSTACRAGR